MYLLKEKDWPEFKFTKDGTLAFKKFKDDVVYIRSVNDSIGPFKGKGNHVGILYRWGDSDEYVAVFTGINPYECKAPKDDKAMIDFKNYIADDPDRYFDLTPVRDITDDDPLYRLATPFNRSNGGFMPVIWNIGAIESDENIYFPGEITSVLQLEEIYPAVNLETERDRRYITIELDFEGATIKFGYNRNHIAYNGRQEDSVISWPIHWYLSDAEENSAALDAALDNMSEQTHKPKFNGKASNLFDAAGLSGKA